MFYDACKKAKNRFLSNDLYSRLIGQNVQEPVLFVHVHTQSPPQHSSEKKFSFGKNYIGVVQS